MMRKSLGMLAVLIAVSSSPVWAEDVLTSDVISAAHQRTPEMDRIKRAAAYSAAFNPQPSTLSPEQLKEMTIGPFATNTGPIVVQGQSRPGLQAAPGEDYSWSMAPSAPAPAPGATACSSQHCANPKLDNLAKLMNSFSPAAPAPTPAH